MFVWLQCSSFWRTPIYSGIWCQPWWQRCEAGIFTASLFLRSLVVSLCMYFLGLLRTRIWQECVSDFLHKCLEGTFKGPWQTFTLHYCSLWAIIDCDHAGHQYIPVCKPNSPPVWTRGWCGYTHCYETHKVSLASFLAFSLATPPKC
jgi:hypothetical protein